MFKNELSEKFNRISPSPELLENVSLMMKQEAEKPKKPVYFNTLRYGGIAAAICLITGTAVIASNINKNEVPTTALETAAAVYEEATSAVYDEAPADFPEMRSIAYAPDYENSEVLLIEEKSADCAVPFRLVNASITFSYSDGTMLSPDSGKTTQIYDEVQAILLKHADEIENGKEAEKPNDSDFTVTLFCPDGMYVNDTPLYDITVYCSKNSAYICSEDDTHFGLPLEYDEISWLYEIY